MTGNNTFTHETLCLLGLCAVNTFFAVSQVYDHWAAGVKDSGIPINCPFKIEGLLTSEADIAKWNKEGLPSNEMSIQNGILTTMSARWPLCIDPQMQVTPR